MNAAQAYEALIKNNGKGQSVEMRYEFQKMLHSHCVSNERKGRFMYWTFEDGSTIRGYGFDFRMTYKAMPQVFVTKHEIDGKSYEVHSEESDQIGKIYRIKKDGSKGALIKGMGPLSTQLRNSHFDQKRVAA